MRAFVVFSCLNQLYGIDIDNVKRILSAQALTHIPDEKAHIEGMFEYEDEVLKVVSFRKLLGEKAYSEQLQDFFPDLKNQHKAWLDALVNCVEDGSEFSKTTDPHACHLGKWIDSFHPDNEDVVNIMKHLTHHHEKLHHSAVDVLELRDNCQDEAQDWIEGNVKGIYNNTLSYLDKISELSAEVAIDMQQCLVLLDKDNESFGLNIDKVEEIVHVDEADLHVSKEIQNMGEFMKIEAILSLKGKLITIIHDIKVF